MCPIISKHCYSVSLYVYVYTYRVLITTHAHTTRIARYAHARAESARINVRTEPPHKLANQERLLDGVSLQDTKRNSRCGEHGKSEIGAHCFPCRYDGGSESGGRERGNLHSTVLVSTARLLHRQTRRRETLRHTHTVSDHVSRGQLPTAARVPK